MGTSAGVWESGVADKSEKKKRLDAESKRTKKSLLFPTAHEVSDDSSVCFWLISVVNVSTTNTLFEQREATSPDVQISSRTVCAERESCDQRGHEKKKKNTKL